MRVPQARAVPLAWGLWALAVVLAAVGATLIAFTLDARVPDNWGFRGYWAVFAPLLATAGLLIARRQPRNSIGWLLLAAGIAAGYGGFAQEYATYAVIVSPGSLPFAVPIAWVNSWSFAFFVCPMLMWIPQLFPTGQPVTPRWRSLLWASALFIPITLVIFGLRSGPLENAAFIENPLGRTGELEAIRIALVAPLSVGVLGLIFASGVSLVTRFRRSTGIERQQLKWVALSGSVMVVAMAVVIATTPATGSNTSKPVQILMITAFGTLPVAIGIAMLRYRLYEVDLIINRALVYAALSTLLAATYVAAVVMFQAALRPFTAGSELSIAGSTLLVAALFQPLRRRVQEAVDRRFYRSRYDAARTLEAFTARLRADVDLQSIRRDLVRVMHETVRPSHATVWIRGARR